MFIDYDFTKAEEIAFAEIKNEKYIEFLIRYYRESIRTVLMCRGEISFSQGSYCDKELPKNFSNYEISAEDDSDGMQFCRANPILTGKLFSADSIEDFMRESGIYRLLFFNLWCVCDCRMAEGGKAVVYYAEKRRTEREKRLLFR